jgi:hypothetical protein
MSSEKPSNKSSGETEPSIKSLWTKEDKEDLKKYSIKILHENCDRSMANSKNLPSNSHLIQYKLNGTIFLDIVQSYTMSKVFDAYYDKFGRDVVQSITYTQGRINPKLYGATKPDDVKRKRR